MNILGISNLENASAALIADGRVVAACEEERFQRKKHYQGFPTHAIRFCLKKAGLTLDQIDVVAMGWVPWRGVVHRVATTLQMAIRNREFGKKMKRGGNYFSIIGEQLHTRKILQKIFGGGDHLRIRYVNHHISHMACGFFLSPFEKAALLSLDGTGEYQTGLTGSCEGGKFRIHRQIKYPYSLGHLYGVFTSFLGFRPNNGEGKVMGLAAYGEPEYEDALQRIIRFDKRNGRLRYDTRYIDYSAALVRSFSRELTSLLGEPRPPESEITGRHQNIAASLQKVVEDIIVEMASDLSKRTGLENLSMSGGVALNCVANAKILERSGFRKMYVPSAPSDAGVSLGSALQVYHRLTGKMPRVNGGSPFLGPGYTTKEISRQLEQRGIAYQLNDEPEREAARRLSRGEIVGWFNGRMEFGPRALGSRSILAPPFPSDMKDRLNERVKFREGFRPFAPAVLENRVPEWFDNSCSSPNMSFAFPVKATLREKIPAVTHVNGRARLQTVSRELNPRFHAILEHYRELTGLPVVLNTSFNLRGEPIVCTPGEAIDCFLKTGMDALFLENCLIRRM